MMKGMELKKIVLILMTSVLFFSPRLVFGVPLTTSPEVPPATPAPAVTKLTTTAEDVSQAYTGLQVTGQKPVLEITWAGFGRASQAESFTREVNKAIGKLYEEKTQEALRGRANFLHFEYEVKPPEDDLVCVLIQTTYTRGAIRNEINTVNFHMEEGRFITISDILGPNGVNVANRVVYEAIKKNPEKYNPNYSDIDDSHSFYVENGSLFIVFGGNEIAAGSQEILSFPVEIAAVADYSLPKAAYYTTGNYGLRMIPVRKVCEAFGYEIKWNDSLKGVELIKGDQTISFLIGVNGYRKGAESRALEISPEIKDATTYVPVSFFGDILGLAHSIDEKGNIIFTMYDK